MRTRPPRRRRRPPPPRRRLIRAKIPTTLTTRLTRRARGFPRQRLVPALERGSRPRRATTRSTMRATKTATTPATIPATIRATMRATSTVTMRARSGAMVSSRIPGGSRRRRAARRRRQRSGRSRRMASRSRRRRRSISGSRSPASVVATTARLALCQKSHRAPAAACLKLCGAVKLCDVKNAMRAFAARTESAAANAPAART